jgi:hypothetical protein
MALLALAPACGFSSSPGDNPGTVDTRPACFGSVVQICLPASAVPDKPRLLPNSSINTDMTARGSLCDQNNNHKDAYCVVTGAGLTLPAGATLSAQGGKPLVLLSTAGIELSGAIDVSSHQSGGAQLRGAGSDPVATDACSFATPAMAATMGGGGAGASLGTPGGGGGNAGGGGGGGGQAGSKLDAFPGALRGGCKGADGAANVGSVAAGGDGGGAIALIAVMPIHIDVAINASGGGGQGGAVGAANGGGGGGSGGMIVIDAPQLTFGPGARLWANGGSGGQGGSPLAGGAPGAESSDPMTPASSAIVIDAGGVGAAGAVGADPGTRGGNAVVSAGGGGGGGGGGFIHAPGLTGDAAISPPSSDPPAAP